MAKRKNKIFFVRHGESESNLKGTFAGQRENSGLTERGREQARQAAKDLVSKNISPKRIFVSPLVRASETAQIIIEIANLHEVEIFIDKRITEYDMGSLTGTPIRKVTSAELVAAEGAEDPVKFMERVHKLLDEIINFDDQVLIVSHAGVGRIIETKKKKLSPHSFYDLPPFPNAKIIELDYD